MERKPETPDRQQTAELGERPGIQRSLVFILRKKTIAVKHRLQLKLPQNPASLPAPCATAVAPSEAKLEVPPLFCTGDQTYGLLLARQALLPLS